MTQSRLLSGSTKPNMTRRWLASPHIKKPPRNMGRDYRKVSTTQSGFFFDNTNIGAIMGADKAAQKPKHLTKEKAVLVVECKSGSSGHIFAAKIKPRS